MTINVPVGTYLTNVAPAGGTWQEVIINAVLSVATTVINNYIQESTNALQKAVNENAKKGSEAFRNSYGKRGTRKQRVIISNTKNWRRPSKYGRFASNYSKFRKYR